MGDELPKHLDAVPFSGQGLLTGDDSAHLSRSEAGSCSWDFGVLSLTEESFQSASDIDASRESSENSDGLPWDEWISFSRENVECVDNSDVRLHRSGQRPLDRPKAGDAHLLASSQCHTRSARTRTVSKIVTSRRPASTVAHQAHGQNGSAARVYRWRRRIEDEIGCIWETIPTLERERLMEFGGRTMSDGKPCRAGQVRMAREYMSQLKKRVEELELSGHLQCEVRERLDFGNKDIMHTAKSSI